MFKHLSVVDPPWYKGQLKESLVDLEKGTQVWFKLNTEKPLTLGPSYWVLEPKAKKIRHIVEDLGNSLIQRQRLTKGWAIANEKETHVLTKIFKPLVTHLVNDPSWSKVGEGSGKGGELFKLDYTNFSNR